MALVGCCGVDMGGLEGRAMGSMTNRDVLEGLHEEAVRLHIGASDEAAIARFKEGMTEYGDPEPYDCRVTQRWSIQAR